MHFYRMTLDRSGKSDGRPIISEKLIDGMRDRVDFRRLVLANDYDAPAPRP